MVPLLRHFVVWNPCPFGVHWPSPVECVKYTAFIGLGFLVQTGHDQTGKGYVVSEWVVWLDKIDLTEYGMWNDRHVRRIHVP